MSGFRLGVRLGVDVGTARVGVARCDREGLLAVPVETVPRGADTAARLVALTEEWDPLEILVGLPVSLAGRDTASTADARALAADIARATGRPVRMVDERLSTVTAHSALRASGRSQRSSRSIVDKIAAVVLLQQAIDVEKSTGNPTGELLPDAQENA